MHALKGGLVGQTFALARGNESEGRKSRIQRSKEERKAMVESFIKKYQKSNNGNFPSLNLTHKEVGGSFYTVREIVRDIIQENRVLGPAKLSSEEWSSDPCLEQDPLCSVTTEPQTLSLISNETHLVSNHYQGTSEELVLGSDGYDTGPERQMFDNGQIVNGSQADVKNQKYEPTCLELQVSEPAEAEKHLEEEWASSMAKITPTTGEEEQVVVSDGDRTLPEYQILDNGQTINAIKLTCTEYQVGEPSEPERNIEELAASKAKVNPITADATVEVFPLPPVTKTTDGFNGSLEEARYLNNPSEEKEIEKVELEPGNGSFLCNGMNSTKNSNLGDDKSVANLSGSVCKEVLEDLVQPSLESSNCLTPGEGIRHDNPGLKVFKAKVSCNDVGTPETFEKGWENTGAKAVNAPNGVHTNILNGTYTGSSSAELNIPEMIDNPPKADVQCSGNFKKGSNPALHRIHLESWEGTTRRSEKRETNPLLATIKAFIAAFVKFWSE